jgi:antitoxin VapB
VALTIDNPEAERLARELAAQNGESVDDAVLKALQARFENAAKWEKIIFPTNDGSVTRAFEEFRQEIAKLPVLDDRTADEILGYDEWGLPH